MMQTSANGSGPEKDPVPEGAAAVMAYFAGQNPPTRATVNMAQRIYNHHWNDPAIQELAVAGVVKALETLCKTDPDAVPGMARWVCEREGRGETFPVVQTLRSAAEAFGNLVLAQPARAMQLALWAETNLPTSFLPVVEYVLTQGAETLRPDDRSQLARQVRERCRQITPCPCST